MAPSSWGRPTDAARRAWRRRAVAAVALMLLAGGLRSPDIGRSCPGLQPLVSVVGSVRAAISKALAGSRRYKRALQLLRGAAGSATVAALPARPTWGGAAAVDSARQPAQPGPLQPLSRAAGPLPHAQGQHAPPESPCRLARLPAAPLRAGAACAQAPPPPPPAAATLAELTAQLEALCWGSPHSLAVTTTMVAAPGAAPIVTVTELATDRCGGCRGAGRPRLPHSAWYGTRTAPQPYHPTRLPPAGSAA